MNSLSVLFRDESSSSYFSRKLFEFGAYANSLDHLDCSRGTLAVFYNKIFILGRKFLSHQWRQLLELELVLFLLTIWIPDCLCLAHTVEIRINSTMQATPAGSGVVTANGEPKPPGPKSLQLCVRGVHGVGQNPYRSRKKFSRTQNCWALWSSTVASSLWMAITETWRWRFWSRQISRSFLCQLKWSANCVLEFQTRIISWSRRRQILCLCSSTWHNLRQDYCCWSCNRTVFSPISYAVFDIWPG